MVITLGEFSLIFVLSLFLQSVQGLSARQTGLAILPLALGAFFTAPVGGRLVDRIGAKPIVLSGMVLETAALFWLSNTISVELPAAGLRLPLFLYGVGIGLATSQINNIVLADVPTQKSGIASAGSSTVRRVGSALGIAIVGTVLATTLTHAAQTGLNQSQLLASTPAYSAIRDQISQALQQSSTFGEDSLQSLLPQENRTSTDQAASAASIDMPALQQTVKVIFQQANAVAVQTVGWIATLFVALGTLSALMLPNPEFEADQPG